MLRESGHPVRRSLSILPLAPLEYWIIRFRMMTPVPASRKRNSRIPKRRYSRGGITLQSNSQDWIGPHARSDGQAARSGNGQERRRHVPDHAAVAGRDDRGGADFAL